MSSLLALALSTRGILESADEYWNDNMENIRGALDLCKKYEECDC